MVGLGADGGGGSALALDVRILGPVEVAVAGRPVELGGAQPRAVIAYLALDNRRVVPVDRLVTRLWGEEPPGQPLASLQSILSRLRRVLEPSRPAARSSVIVSEAPGYVMRVPREAVDLTRFRDRAVEARRDLSNGAHADAVAHFETALAEWRGSALSGIGPDEVVGPIALALDEERLSVVEDRFDAVLALGRHAEAVGELSIAASENPLRERLSAMLAVALYRSQRQADALRAIEQTRRTLIDELGLDPGPALRELERRILDHDPSLLAAPTARSGAAITTAAPSTTRTASDSEERSRTVPPGVVPSVGTGTDAGLVGRDTEWIRLLGALDRAASGRPGVVLLEGEPGIGKSAIAEQLVETAAARGWRVAVGRCVDGDLAPALWPIVEVAREFDGDGRTVAHEQVAGDAVRTPVEIADELLRVIDAAGPAPACVFVDDLHWADRLTLDVLGLLAERLRDRRALVVGALRPVSTAPDSTLRDGIGRLATSPRSERIVLSPLRPHDVAELMRRAGGTDPSEDSVRVVHERSGGNPLFVAELSRLFGEGGVVTDEVPDAVRDVVHARLAALPPATIGALQVAAVAGERLDVPVVVAATGLGDEACLDALDPAIATGVLVPGADHELRFAHALVRDAVVADISPLQRARLHRAVADAVETVRGTGVDVIETIARHRLAAMPVGDPLRTATQLVDAADVARWRGGFDAADQLADAAIDLVGRLPRSVEVDTVELRALEGTIAGMGRRFGAPGKWNLDDRLDALIARTGSDAARVLGLYVKWWEIDEQPVGQFADLAASALAIAQRSDNRFARILGFHVAGFQAFMEGRIEDASRWYERGAAATGVREPGDDPGYVPTVHLPAHAGMVAQLRGDDETAQSHIVDRYAAWQRVRRTVDRTTSIDVAFTHGVVAALRGDARRCRRAVAHLAGAGAPPVSSYFSSSVAIPWIGPGTGVLEGWAASKLGDLHGAHRATAALQQLDPVTDALLRSCLRTFTAEALMQAGDATAVALLEQARGEAVERGEVWWLAETLRLSAIADVRFGDGSQAARLLAEATDLAHAQGVAVLFERLSATTLDDA